MKTIYATAFGLAAFFALNCGSGDGYGGSGSGSQASQETGAAQPSGSSTSSPPPAPSGDVAAKVVVEGHDFNPPEVHVKVGQTVRWVWVSGSHNVVSGTSCTPDGNFTSGSSTEGPGSQFDHTFDAAGTFPYYCDPHCSIGMVGKVIVE